MRKVIKCIAFSVILCLTVSFVYRHISWKDTNGAYIETTKQLDSIDNDLVDVVFTGSSHTYCSIYPSCLWDAYGISAFNMSTSGQDRESTYYYLKNLLKKQSPKVVFVELYGATFERHAVEGNVIRNMISMKPSKNSYDLINAYVEEEERMNYLLRWPIVHTRYRELSKYDYYEYPINKFGKGECPGWVTAKISQSKYAAWSDEIEISEANKDWVDRLIKLAEENNFELVFFVAPFVVDEEKQQILNGVESYLTENNVSFYDFNKLANEIDFVYEHDMIDESHTNGYGATKISNYLGEVITKDFDLENHKSDSRYDSWNTDSKYVSYSKILQDIKNADSIKEALSLATMCEDYIIVLSLDGDFDNLIPELLEMGLSQGEIVNGGKWLFKNGVWEKQISNLPGERKEIQVSRFDSYLVQYVEDNVLAGLLFENNSQIRCTDGINVSIYDCFTEELVANLFQENY